MLIKNGRKNQKQNYADFFGFLFILLIGISCISEPPIQKPEFLERGAERYISIRNPRSKEVVDLVSKIENESSSYSGSFRMRIQNFEPTRENFTLKGEIFFDRESGKMKIVLMDQLFGFVISKLITDGETIQLQSAGQESIHNQSMGDIILVDPNTKKRTVIPFPVIYSILANKNLSKFESKKALIDTKDKRVLLKRPNEEYLFEFTASGLKSVEMYSDIKKLKAITTAVGKVQYPPRNVVTRIVHPDTGSELNHIEIKMNSVRTLESVPASRFHM